MRLFQLQTPSLQREAPFVRILQIKRCEMSDILVEKAIGQEIECFFFGLEKKDRHLCRIFLVVESHKEGT